MDGYLIAEKQQLNELFFKMLLDETLDINIFHLLIETYSINKWFFFITLFLSNKLEDHLKSDRHFVRMETRVLL